MRTGAVLSNPISSSANKKTTPCGVVFLLAEDEGFELHYFELYGVFETFVFTKCAFCIDYLIISNCSF